MAKKKLTNKQILVGGLAIIGVCLVVCLTAMLLNRSTSREPTQQELEAYGPYADAVQSLNADAILAQCAEAGQEEIGDHTYTTYTSETLAQVLYQCETLDEIIISDEGLLNISYTDTAGHMVVLGFNEDGMNELAIYDSSTDTLFQIVDGETVVWEKFGRGIQWGA